MSRSRAPPRLDAGTILDAFAPTAALSGRVRYPVIVNLIGRAIADKRLAAGARLPTQRSLARHLGIAIGTVTRAYSEAERLGLVVGEVGAAPTSRGTPRRVRSPTSPRIRRWSTSR